MRSLLLQAASGSDYRQAYRLPAVRITSGIWEGWGGVSTTTMQIFGKVTKVGDQKTITPSENQNGVGSGSSSFEPYTVQTIEVMWYMPITLESGVTYRPVAVAIELRKEMLRLCPQVGDLVAADCDCHTFGYRDRDGLTSVAMRLVASRLTTTPPMSDLMTRIR